MSGKLIRDAVYGDIHLGALEIELINTPEFQRLRGIKQLGTAYLVFPSALHTRFEHSVGTAWMSQRLSEAVSRTRTVNAEEIQPVRIAALLHDIMHILSGTHWKTSDAFFRVTIRIGIASAIFSKRAASARFSGAKGCNRLLSRRSHKVAPLFRISPEDPSVRISWTTSGARRSLMSARISLVALSARASMLRRSKPTRRA